MNKEQTYQPMSVGELAVRWNVSRHTVRNWIKPFLDELGPIHGKLFTPRQVKIILEHLE